MVVSVLLVVFFLFANFFVVSRRIFGLVPAKSKTFVVVGFELLVLVLLVGLILIEMEISQFGSRYNQSWEFYVIVFSLVLVSIFPGFVVRYLWPKSQ